MNKTIFIASIISLILFNSCEEIEENSRVTVYISNSGAERRYAYVTAVIGGQTEFFFTPEGSNITLECNSNSSHAAYFSLPPGKYTYKVNDGTYVWTDSFTLSKNQCYLIELSY